MATLSCVKPFRFRGLSNSGSPNSKLSASLCDLSAISSFDVDEQACDLCAMSYGALLLWVAGQRTQIHGHQVLWQFDREDLSLDSHLAAQQPPYVNGQSAHRRPIAPAEYRDPRGSAAHSRPQAHELPCAKAAIRQAIKPLAIPALLPQVRSNDSELAAWAYMKKSALDPDVGQSWC